MGLLAMLRSKVEEEKPVRLGKTLEVIHDEDPISLLRRKILCALEYTGNYQEVLIENGRIAEVEKMEKFAKDRVRDALVHAGFIVPPSEAAGTTWGDACFDAIGVSSKYLILGEVKWGDEVTESEVESLIGRAVEAEKRGRGRELVLFIASLRNLGGRARELVGRCPKKNFVVSFEEVRPYNL
ncbi:hypothetical protein H0N99_01340 [Candidatus Micrarchaeota archaeon]|nr:hypothetical protein [Candidatus Micrarchaeota archaeon]